MSRVLYIRDNIVIPIPVVDKRSQFDPSNLAGVITSTSGDVYYKIGTAAGTLDRRYLSTEIELSHSRFILINLNKSGPPRYGHLPQPGTQFDTRSICILL